MKIELHCCVDNTKNIDGFKGTLSCYYTSLFMQYLIFLYSNLIYFANSNLKNILINADRQSRPTMEVII